MAIEQESSCRKSFGFVEEKQFQQQQLVVKFGKLMMICNQRWASLMCLNFTFWSVCLGFNLHLFRLFASVFVSCLIRPTESCSSQSDIAMQALTLNIKHKIFSLKMSTVSASI